MTLQDKYKKLARTLFNNRNSGDWYAAIIVAKKAKLPEKEYADLLKEGAITLFDRGYHSAAIEVSKLAGPDTEDMILHMQVKNAPFFIRFENHLVALLLLILFVVPAIIIISIAG